MSPRKLRFAILANESAEDSILWKEACEKFPEKVEYEIIDWLSDDGLEKVMKGNFDALLSKPGGVRADFKELYDEKIRAVENQYFIFPSPLEVYLYENKRFLSFWLKTHHIPHPLTHVFYHEKKANQFIQEINWPVVAKSNIGASASGVKILKSLMEAEEYIASAFGKGVKREVGPKWRKLKFTRVIQLLTTPSIIFKRLKHYQNIQSDVQKGFVILQDYVSHDFEWRVVRIGDSFFAHKKLKVGELASGSLLKNYDNPPLSLFDFVQDMTSKFELHSVAVDIFESGNGNYLVNEVQCIFGQSDQYQMMVDGKVGRYVRQNNEWVFEEGDFNGNQCYDLRLEWVIKECRNESTLR